MSDLHSELITYIFNHPEMIDDNFIPISKEYAIGRGTMDMVGKIASCFCILEMKIDKAKSSSTKAKVQLLRYGREINNLLTLVGYEEKQFKFFYVRWTGKEIEVYCFSSEKELESFKHPAVRKYTWDKEVDVAREAVELGKTQYRIESAAIRDAVRLGKTRYATERK